MHVEYANARQLALSASRSALNLSHPSTLLPRPLHLDRLAWNLNRAASSSSVTRCFGLRHSAPPSSARSFLFKAQRNAETSHPPVKDIPDQDPDLCDKIKALMRSSAQPVSIIASFLPEEEGGKGHAGRNSSPTSPSARQGRLVHGATLSSFSSISLSPPLISFSLKTPSRMADALIRGSSSGEPHFILNVLSHLQADAAAAFSRPGLVPFLHVEGGTPLHDRQDQDPSDKAHPFEAQETFPSTHAGGIPVFRKSLGSLACSVVNLLDLSKVEGGVPASASNGNGTSILFIARVHAIERLGAKQTQGSHVDSEKGLEEAAESDSLRPLVYWNQRFQTVGL